MRMSTLGAGLLLTMSGVALGQQTDALPQAAEPAEEQVEVKKLIVGDRAPGLSVETWLKGSEITSFEKGKVYVVEFWATWCGPCIRSIPHLTEVQAHFKDNNVTVIGVAASERAPDEGEEDNRVPNLRKFLDGQGEKMAYTVAYDADRTMSKDWMEAAGQGGIPTSFVVNQEGRVAWIGHPMDGLDDVLEQVVAGKWDLEKYAAEEARKAQIEARAEPIIRHVQSNFRDGNVEEALKGIDELIALDSGMFGEWAYFKFQIMTKQLGQYDDAYAFAREAVNSYLNDNAQLLNAMAWMILDDSELEERDYDLAMAAALRANELTNNEDAAIIDTVARAYFEQGDVDAAIEHQRRAAEKAPAGQMKDDIAKRLAQYEKAKSEG